MTLLKEELRAATQPYHEAIENAVQIMRRNITMADYIQYLAATYRFYALLEPRLIAGDAAFCGGALDASGRRKTPRLRADISLLRGSGYFDNLVVCQQAPSVTSMAELIGCSYVIEGSTLGAMIMYRHLNKYLGVTPATGASFVYGYGTRTAARWKSFLGSINAIVLDAQQRNACIASAIETFTTLGDCLASSRGTAACAVIP